MAGKVGVRLNKRQIDSVRDHIKVAMLVKKLQRFAESEPVIQFNEDGKITSVTYILDGKDVTMTKDQIAAANLLLSKSLPTLSSTDINADVNHTNYIPVSDREQDPRITYEQVNKAEPLH